MSIPKATLNNRYGRTIGSMSRDQLRASSASKSVAILDDYGYLSAKHFEGIVGLHVDVFTDTLNPADQAQFELLVQRLEVYDIISTMRERTPFSAALQARLPRLKLLLTTGVRNASLDLNYAARNGIIVAGTTGARPSHPEHSTARGDAESPPPPGYDSTTQHTFALLLSLCGRIPQDDAALRSATQAWQSGYALAICGKIFGVCGLGKLGANAARVAAQAFGMRVIAWSENLTQQKADAAATIAGLSAGTFEAVSKAELFARADVISMHYVLSDRSKGIVGYKELKSMKPTAVLVNTARGPLIDEAALLETLTRGGIRGAALDVWWQEPLPADSPWRSYHGKSELVMSPHMGYVNEGTINRWYEEQADNVRRWLAGEEVLNRIN